MGNQSNASTEYQRQHPLLDVIGKLLLNVAIAGSLLGIGFLLLLLSNIGPAYWPSIMDGELDMWLRLTMLGIGAIIWLVTPIWLIWSNGVYSYRVYKRIKSINTSA